MQVKFHPYNAPRRLGLVRSLAKTSPAMAICECRPHADEPEQAARLRLPSCAWAKPAAPHVFEFCENGAKATHGS